MKQATIAGAPKGAANKAKGSSDTKSSQDSSSSKSGTNAKTQNLGRSTEARNPRNIDQLEHNMIGDRSSFLYQILFLKGMAAVYLIAFTITFHEVTALIGSDGLLPASTFLNWMRSQRRTLSDIPTIYWWSSEINEFVTKLFPALLQFDAMDTSLLIGSLVGIGVSASVLMWKRMMNFLSFFVLWFLHLSVVHIGQTFFKFHWDQLLLELGFLAMFFTPATFGQKKSPIFDEISTVVRDLLKWCAFRLHYSSGIIKLSNQCPKWWSLTALDQHMLVQPSPTPLSWYVHHLPLNIQKLLVASNFIILIGGSLLLMLPYRRFRIFAMVLLLGQQVFVALTGNIGFLNILTILATLAAADDGFLDFCVPGFVWKAIGAGDEIKQLKEKKDLEKKNSEKAGEDLSLNRIIDSLIFLIQLLIFASAVIYAFERYFPIDAIFGESKVRFTAIDVRVYLINGHIPNLALVLGLLGCVNELFSNAVRYQYLNRLEIVNSLKRVFAAVFAFVMFMVTAYMFFAGIDKEIHIFPINIPSLAVVAENASPFRIANSYGLFPRIIGEGSREELVFEVSADGKQFFEMPTYSKIDLLEKPLAFISPYQSRLDWQLWHSGSSKDVQEPYLSNLVYKLVLSKPNALSLFAKNPLGEGVEIQMLNVVKYYYSFTSESEFKQTGKMMKRSKRLVLSEKLSPNFPPEELITRYKLDKNPKKYPIHPLRTIPIIPIIWAWVFIAAAKNLIGK